VNPATSPTARPTTAPNAPVPPTVVC
jgi:hypothetical protein